MHARTVHDIITIIHLHSKLSRPSVRRSVGLPGTARRAERLPERRHGRALTRRPLVAGVEQLGARLKALRAGAGRRRPC